MRKYEMWGDAALMFKVQGEGSATLNLEQIPIPKTQDLILETLVASEFIRACSIREIPRRRGKEIVFDEETQVAIFNIDNHLYAVSNICPHQHAPVIAEGYIEDCTITCPLHGWVYDLVTGQAIGGTGRLKTYQVYLDGDDVMLEKPEPEEPTWTIE